MTNFLKTSALIAFLLSSFSITALADDSSIAPEVKMTLQLLKSDKENEKAAGKKAEEMICKNHTNLCENNMLKQNALDLIPMESKDKMKDTKFQIRAQGKVGDFFKDNWNKFTRNF